MPDAVTIIEEVTVDKPRRWLRNIRIAVSVFFGLLTVALCMLWVRSYWRYDLLRVMAIGWKLDVNSDGGIVRVRYDRAFRHTDRFTWQLRQFNIEPAFHAPRISYNHSSSDISADFPHFALLLVPISGVVLTWLPCSRYSLRTLLIATTLVAVVLGIMCYTVG